MQIYQSQKHNSDKKEVGFKQNQKISTKIKGEQSTGSLNKSLCLDRSESILHNQPIKYDLQIKDDEVQKHLFCIIKSKEPIIARKYLQNQSLSPIQKNYQNHSVILEKNSHHLPSIKSVTPTKSRPNSFVLPSISSDKKEKKQVISKLEEHLLKSLHQIQDLLPRENSSFADIQYQGYEECRQSLHKKFFSQRLDCNIEAKNFQGIRMEEMRVMYEEEKKRHKGLEGKIHCIVDLLAYDDVGMRLFYEMGLVNLSQINKKYRNVNISFQENDLLCIMRQMISNTTEFISIKWFYNNYQDPTAFVFVKAGTYQEYKIKYSNITFASQNTQDYHFENIHFTTNSQPQLHSTTITSEPTIPQDSTQNNYSNCNLQTIVSQINSIQQEDITLSNSQNNVSAQRNQRNALPQNNSSNQNTITTNNQNRINNIEQQQIQSYNKNRHSPQQNQNPTRISQEGSLINQNGKQNQLNQSDSPHIQLQNQKSASKQKTLSKNEVNGTKESDESQEVWQKIMIYEVMQICSLIYNIFLQQNYQNVDLNNKDNSEFDFFADYPKLQFYLMSFIKNSEDYQTFIQSIQNLKADRTIPQNIQIEDTLLDQIRQDSIQNTSNSNLNYASIQKSSSQLKNETIQISVCRNEIKSMAMIAVQTINKQLQNELLILQNCDRNKMLLPETQDFYDNLLNSNLLQKFDKSSLQIAAQIVEELLIRIDDKQNPFYFAEQIFNKALIHFKTNQDTATCISLLKNCNQIIQRIQGNEQNEICGKSYLLMSQAILKQSNNRQRALEYAMISYEIRKQVYGQQSRTIELVESLKQIAHIYQQKGALDETYKYLDRCFVIIEEIKHQFHRQVVQISSELALLSFNMQNYSASMKKCMKVLDIYKKCGPNVINYHFPLIMNLYALTRLKYIQTDACSKQLDNNTIKDIFKQGLKAAKLMGAYKSENQQINQTTYQNLKSLYTIFLKSIESEEYLAIVQKSSDQKPKNNNPLARRIDPFISPTNPNKSSHLASKQSQIKGSMQHQQQRNISPVFDYS